jgi:hypothetical protein
MIEILDTMLNNLDQLVRFALLGERSFCLLFEEFSQ